MIWTHSRFTHSLYFSVFKIRHYSSLFPLPLFPGAYLPNDLARFGRRVLCSPWFFLSSVAPFCLSDKKIFYHSLNGDGGPDLISMGSKRANLEDNAYTHEQSATFANHELSLKSRMLYLKRTKLRKKGRNGCQNGDRFCSVNIATVCEWHVFVHGLYTISDDIQGSRFLLLFSRTPTLCSLVKVLFSYFRVTFRSSIVHWTTMIRAATRLFAVKKVKTKCNFDVSLLPRNLRNAILPNIPENSSLIS